MAGKIAPKYVFFVLLAGALFIGLAGCTALVTLGLMDPPGATPFQQPTSTAESAGTGLIAGRVWQDQCRQSEGCQPAPDGSVRPNGVEDPSEPGIAGVTLNLGLGVCPSTGFNRTVSGANGTFVFGNLSPGTYCVSVDPSTDANTELLGSAPWTHPTFGQGISRITVTLKDPAETRLVNFGRQAATLVETPVPTVKAPPDVPTATPAPDRCLNWAEFVTDVTIADSTRIAADRSFDKTWRLRNVGTCSWNTNYDLTFVSGNRLEGPSTKALTRSVAPGQTVDLTVRLRSPEDTGFYRGYWMLRSDDNQLFGIGPKANSPFWVQIIVGQLGTTNSGSWRGEYFTRRDLKGTAGFVRNDPVIDFNWNDRSPGSPLDNDNFSVRWTGKSQFEAGTYRFTLRVDDGARLWVDNKLVIDSWKDGSSRDLKEDVALARGTHDLRVEYYERRGTARIRLTWDEVDSPSFSDWKGQYWNNREFKGSPALTRNDKDIKFDWEQGAPAVGLPSDDFSVRWTRRVNFNPGTYRFNLRSDDGVRLWIDDDRIIDEWHDSSASETYQRQVTLSGEHRIKVEYYERRGRAQVRLWWEDIQETPTPSPTPSPTPTATVPAVTEEPTEEPSPTATDTSVPSATPSPTATDTPPSAPQQILNFAASACSAGWRNEAGELDCPGDPDASAGAVYILSDPVTEAGEMSGQEGLITEPEQAVSGLIRGSYPTITPQSGDRLIAQIGCLSNQPSCSVEFEVLLRQGEKTYSLGSWQESSDGSLRSIELDLSPYAGQSVSPVLQVQARDFTGQNSAVWISPRIMR